MSPPHLFIDGIGPFFRGLESERINWSKIPFADLPQEPAFWQRLEGEFGQLLDRVQALGYQGVSLDDLAHLTPHPLHDAETNARIEFFVERFAPLFVALEARGLKAWVTADVLTLSPAASAALGSHHRRRSEFHFELVERFFARFPGVHGLILRIGESDGLDVRDSLRSELHLKSATQANRFLRALLPRTRALGKTMVLRTWTVGAHRIGDLIWHRGRLAQCLEGIEGPGFVLSMKPGESDFFRHLPLNRAFHGWSGPKILELQARPEYEGAGEIPSFLGFEWERLRQQMAGVENLVGVSVWAQCGGWHRFRRLTFLDADAFWAELNARIAADLFGRGISVRESLAQWLGAERAEAATEFLQRADRVIDQLWYLPELARQSLWFRRVRIPPLLHVYWDTIFFHSSLRKILRYLVQQPEAARAQAQEALLEFPRMIELARELGWPVEDVEFLRDTGEMLALAREYYFTPWSPELVEQIKAAKARYKAAWPKGGRARLRIKTELRPSRLKRRQLLWARWLLRRQSGYRRLMDQVVTLHLLAAGYRLLQKRPNKVVPKFLRQSAMGVGSLLR